MGRGGLGGPDDTARIDRTRGLIATAQLRETVYEV
jgi:hypothetical protein